MLSGYVLSYYHLTTFITYAINILSKNKIYLSNICPTIKVINCESLVGALFLLNYRYCRIELFAIHSSKFCNHALI